MPREITELDAIRDADAMPRFDGKSPYAPVHESPLYEDLSGWRGAQEPKTVEDK